MSIMSRVMRLIRTEMNAALGRLDANRNGSRPNHGDSNYNAQRETGQDDDNYRESYREGSYGSNGSSSSGKTRTKADELAKHYAALEVPNGSDLATVRAAYKRLMKKYHPDRYGTDPEKMKVATEIVKGLNHAYSELTKHLK